ncbi:hypothetical protein VY88_05240 [Azospirillum thiophilum]|uniref:Uncharacterized protein n=1 Tax=Azospirillum thiophilum TaxID=528244 RepID=A0AAC9EX90_9PROT|nr:hypothetical protein [Azospirillum thiophilum]ALG70779.1 hypothetical protein AL072_07470 [Azospirillum thiophilum]KJR65556.1 hypothetical protein VY88_05240 [Azospirillum thiophilum]
MYYAELSGPNGKPSVLSTAVQNGASKTAGTAKDGLTKSDAKTADGGKTDKSSQSPAYTISQSMESLLDSLTGKGGGSGASQAAGGGSAASGSSGVDRARQAQSLMQSALDHANDLSGAFGKAVDTLKQGLGDTLSALGVPQNRIDDAVKGFGDNVKSKLGNMNLSDLTVDMQASQSQWSIESHGIELEIQDGDRSVRISFAKSTLDFRRDDQRLQASLGKGGSEMALSATGMTTTATGKSTGMIVRSDGFSDDEIKDILGKLNDMASKGGGSSGMKGLAVLKPTTGKDGVTHLSLDLSAPVEGLTSGKSAATTAAASTGTAAKSQSVDLTA